MLITFTGSLLVAGAVYYYRLVSQANIVAASGASVARGQAALKPTVESAADDSDWRIILDGELAKLGRAIDDAFHLGSMIAVEEGKPAIIRDFQDETTLAVFIANGTGTWALLLNRSDYSALDRLPIRQVMTRPEARETPKDLHYTLEVCLHSCDPCSQISVLQVGLSEPVIVYMYCLQECADRPVTCRHDNSILSHWEGSLNIPQRNGWSLFGIAPSGAARDNALTQEYALCGSGGTPCAVVRYVPTE